MKERKMDDVPTIFERDSKKRKHIPDSQKTLSHYTYMSHVSLRTMERPFSNMQFEVGKGLKWILGTVYKIKNYEKHLPAHESGRKV
jgi:hypothetical protein